MLDMLGGLLIAQEEIIAFSYTFCFAFAPNNDDNDDSKSIQEV